jgi:hypothetical protein
MSIYIKQSALLNNVCYRSLNIIILTIFLHFLSLRHSQVHPVAQLVEAQHYKPEGRGFDYRWCHWKFLLTIRAVALRPWGQFNH